MKLSLSTNWCNQRFGSGDEIVDKALELGFEELELGYHTTPHQAEGFKRRLGEMPVGSVHAFCPVPISAPQGYPELYSLASFDAEERRMAQIQIKRTAQFAADMGADTVVLHTGRVMCNTLLPWFRARKRMKDGFKMIGVVKDELWCLITELEKLGVTLALENLPYYEGFPNEVEIEILLEMFKGRPVKAWFDTGHHRVRECNGWVARKGDAPIQPGTSQVPNFTYLPLEAYAGMHLNDVMDVNDDHFPPGEGRVDFAALKPMAEAVRHVVFEPSPSTRSEALKKGIEHIRKIWEL